MSHLMDYGDDWPPRPPRRRRSLLRWLSEGKRRRRAGFDRYFWVNVVLIVGVAVACAVVLRLTDRPAPPFEVSHRTPQPTAQTTPDVSGRSGSRHPRHP